MFESVSPRIAYSRVISSIARRFARFNDAASLEIKYTSTGITSIDTNNSRHDTTAAPIKHASILSGSRTARPSNV